jgi:nucleotide-binding universal stress UspA family protein
MEERMPDTDIVVGYDGSDTSKTALRWAAAEARLRATPLRIVAAYTWTWPPEAFGGPVGLPEIVAEQFQQLVADAVAEAATLEPGIDVTGTAVPGDPASVLLEFGSTAAMIVVGNRGQGGFASLLLGSVSQQIATHATRPVVVVRGRPDTARGPIVVGVDGSPSAERALELAFDEAQRRGCPLTALHGYHLPIPPRGVEVPSLLYDQNAVREAAANDLNTALAPWRDKHPTVDVRARVGLGSPAKHLVELSSDAGLLIVGSGAHSATRWRNGPVATFNAMARGCPR